MEAICPWQGVVYNATSQRQEGVAPPPSLYVPDGPCIFPPTALPKEPSLGERHLSQTYRIKLAKEERWISSYSGPSSP